MKICKVCGREFKSTAGLYTHVRAIHKLTSEEYYLKYLDVKTFCKQCNKLLNVVHNMTKDYYNKRRKVLDENGYSEYKLIHLTYLTQVKELPDSLVGVVN